MKIETFFEEQVKIINKDFFVDERGWFIQSFDKEIELAINTQIIQENVSFLNHLTIGVYYKCFPHPYI